MSYLVALFHTRLKCKGRLHNSFHSLHSLVGDDAAHEFSFVQFDVLLRAALYKGNKATVMAFLSFLKRFSFSENEYVVSNAEYPIKTLKS